jgi:hypothetical protein
MFHVRRQNFVRQLGPRRTNPHPARYPSTSANLFRGISGLKAILIQERTFSLFYYNKNNENFMNVSLSDSGMLNEDKIGIK